MHARRLKAKVLVGSCCLPQFTIFCSLMRRLYTAHCTSILFVKWIATHKGNSQQRYKRMLYTISSNLDQGGVVGTYLNQISG